MNIIDLFAHIGLKADTGPANDFLKSIGGIKGQLVGAISGTLSLAAAVKAVNESFSDTLAMKKFADDTGASVQEMQKWKQVADQVNGAGEGVAASIRAITQNQEKIKLGQGNISGYQLLGIDPRSDPFKVLEALRVKTQGMSQGMRRNIAAQFGVSNDLVATLELTNAQFDKMAGNAYVVSPKSIAGVNQARAAVTELMNRLNYLRTESVAKLAPMIKQGVEWLQRIITAGQRIITMVDSFIRGSVGWKAAILGVVGAFIALNAAVALPVAGILLLFAILEDLYVYSKGGKSVFGELVKSFPELAKVFDSVLGVIKDIGPVIKALFGDEKSMNMILDKWGNWGKVIKGVADYLKLVADYWTFIFDKIIEGIGKVIELASKVELPEWLSSFIGGAGDFAANAIMNAPSAIRAGAGAVSNTASYVFNINGANDPGAVGDEVERRLGNTYKDTRSPYQNGKAEK